MPDHRRKIQGDTPDGRRNLRASEGRHPTKPREKANQPRITTKGTEEPVFHAD